MNLQEIHASGLLKLRAYAASGTYGELRTVAQHHSGVASTATSLAGTSGAKGDQARMRNAHKRAAKAHRAAAEKAPDETAKLSHLSQAKRHETASRDVAPSPNYGLYAAVRTARREADEGI